jgi:hypothetical protein
MCAIDALDKKDMGNGVCLTKHVLMGREEQDLSLPDRSGVKLCRCGAEETCLTI